MVLHYSVTLQYSAYFHIYFNIAQKYENEIKKTPHLKNTHVLKDWVSGLCQNPFKSEDDVKEEEQAASAGTNDYKAKMKAMKQAKKSGETPS